MAAKPESRPQGPDAHEDDAPACTTSVTIDLTAALGPRLDHLSEPQQGALPNTNPYPQYTSGLLLVSGIDVQIHHGRADGRCRVQLTEPYAISRPGVDLCLKQLFTDARCVRIHCLQLRFKVRDLGVERNGRGSPENPARRGRNGTRATPTFRRNSWDADSRTLQILVEVDRDVLAGFGIATLRDVVGLRQVKLDALLSPGDICQLPVPWTFSKSREVLTARLQRMLEEFLF